MGGGVALYIKQEIAYKQYMLIENLNPGIERVCITMSVKGQVLGVVLCIGRPRLNISSYHRSLLVGKQSRSTR